MQEHGQVFAFIITFVIFLLVLRLIRKRKITEHFAVLWVAVSVVLLLASSLGFPYLFRIAKFLGIVYPPSALFLLAIFGLTLLVIQLFAWVSKLNERSRSLVQQVALLRDELNQMARRAAELDTRLKMNQR
jgi:hypothetical protein